MQKFGIYVFLGLPLYNPLRVGDSIPLTPSKYHGQVPNPYAPSRLVPLDQLGAAPVPLAPQVGNGNGWGTAKNVFFNYIPRCMFQKNSHVFVGINALCRPLT